MLVVFGGGPWQLRIWVPPATLWLKEVAVTPSLTIDRREPVTPMSTVPQGNLHRRGLDAYTAIRAPRGLDEDVFHVWHHDGRVIDRIRLHIEGGRQEGYRAWTHKRHFPTDSVGRWTIQVVTEAGQLIGVLRFRVVETAAGAGTNVEVSSGRG